MPRAITKHCPIDYKDAERILVPSASQNLNLILIPVIPVTAGHRRAKDLVSADAAPMVPMEMMVVMMAMMMMAMMVLGLRIGSAQTQADGQSRGEYDFTH